MTHSSRNVSHITLCCGILSLKINIILICDLILKYTYKLQKEVNVINNTWRKVRVGAQDW